MATWTGPAGGESTIDHLEAVGAGEPVVIAHQKGVAPARQRHRAAQISVITPVRNLPRVNELEA